MSVFVCTTVLLVAKCVCWYPWGTCSVPYKMSVVWCAAATLIVRGRWRHSPPTTTTTTTTSPPIKSPWMDEYFMSGHHTSPSETKQSGKETDLKCTRFLKAHSSRQFLNAHSSGQFLNARSSGQFLTAHSSGQFLNAHSSGQFLNAHSSGQFLKAHSSGQFLTAHNSEQFLNAHNSGQFLEAHSSGQFLTAHSSGQHKVQELCTVRITWFHFQRCHKDRMF